MKVKMRVPKRILSLVLALVMVLGMMPMMSMTAYAATEVPELGKSRNFITYSDGATQYYKYNNYLYKVQYTNLKDVSSITLGISNNKLVLWQSSSAYFRPFTNSGFTAQLTPSNLPKSQGGTTSGYSSNTSNDIKKPVVNITCIAVSAPTWNWTDTSSAKATFTVNGTDYCVTVNAGISSNTVEAQTCLEKGKTTYTASVTFNGQTYTDTKTVEGVAGPHSYTYSASGNTVTEKCSNCSNHTATAMLTATNQTYTGSAITTGASVTYSNGWAGSKEHGEITYSNNLNVGDAIAKVTVAGKELTTTFKINAADISEADVTVRPTMVTYGQTADASAEISVKWNGATLTIDKDYKVEWDKTPYNSGAGTYTATITGIGNFTGTTSGSTVVESARLTNVSVSQTGTLIYDGESKTPTVTTTATTVDGSQVTFAYSKVIEDVYGEMPSFTGAGTYTVYYKASAPNHEDYKGSFTVTIAPTDGSATVSIEGWEYGDTAKTPVPVSTTNGTDNVTYQYKVKGADDNTYTSTVPTAVGEYTVKATFGATQNHKEVTATADFAISKRAVTVTANNAGKTYGGAEPELTWKVTSGSELANEKLSINISRAEGENAGGYTITVSQTEDANPNYNITFENGTFTIKPAKLTITANSTGITYGDAVPTYTVTYSGFAGSENEHNLGGTLAFACDYKQFSDATTYEITPSGLTSDNYDITFVPGTLTVKPKAITVTIDNKTSVYGKEIVELTATDDGIVNNDENVYSLATTATSTDDVGTYAITGTALDGNYDITFVDGTYTITKANAAFTAPTANILTYNGEDQTLIVKGSTHDGTMVYSLEKEGTYTTELPKAMTAGTYHVWYKVIGDSNHTNSDPASIPVEIKKADPAIGAVTAGVVNDTLETSAIVLTRENPTVEGMLTVDAGQTLSLGENTIRYTFLPTDTENYKAVTGTVTVTVKDTIAPTGTVTISTNSWNQFLNDITFGLFFKETQTVSVSATDNLSGVAKIEYIESKTAMDLDAVKAAQQWTEMKNGSVSVTLEDTKQFIYYIRITDNSGNVTYLSSDGAVYDTTDPEIKGVNDGATYYTTQIVTVTDNIATDTITLNGKAAASPITLEGNKEATYIIVATDKAGNSTTVTVKMAPISDITGSMEGKNDANVTSDDKANLQTIVDTATELLQDEDITAEEKAELEKAKADAEALIQVIEDTAAGQKAVTDKAAEYDEDKVKSTDKAELEKLAEDIEALLDTNNLTQDERAALETLLEQVEGMTDTIDKTAADSKTATDAIDALNPETVKSTDKAAVEAALETIENLLDGDHLTEDERKALEDAKADAEALLAAIEDAAKAANTENTAKVEDVTAENVTPEDKSDLQDAKADLEKALEDNSGNYTEEEKKAIEDEIARIDEALQIIENVEAVEDAISDLPATVEPDDEETVAKIEDAKKVYDELTEYEKSLVDEDTKKKLDDLTAAAVAYKIVKGDGSKWTKGGTSGLSFTANGPLGKFSGVEIDGKVIDAKYYDAVAGSTVITLKASYLETLSVGEHTITVVYTDGEAEGTFKINAKSVTPATGDNSDIMLWTTLLFISVLAMAVLVIGRKRFAYKPKYTK